MPNGWLRLVCSVFIVGIVAGCGASPKKEPGSEPTRAVPVASGAQHAEIRAGCANNLKQLVMGCSEYAAEHGGQFPNRLSELRPKYVSDLKVFSCPGSGKTIPNDAEIDAQSDYEIVAGQTTATDASKVLLREKTDANHSPAGRTMCSVGGTTQFVKAS